MLMGIQGRALKAHIKTHGAAFSPLRLPFQPLDAREPVLPVIIGINNGNGALLGKTYIFLFTDFVFLWGWILGL